MACRGLLVSLIQQSRYIRFSPLILLYLTVAAAATSSGETQLVVNATLTADTRYELFTCDFELQFHIPPEFNLSARGGGYAELVSVDGGARIVGLGVPPSGVPVGIMTIDCGKLDVAGVVRGRLLDRNNGRTVLAQTHQIEVTWPKDPAIVTLTFPDKFEALTKELSLGLTVNEEVRRCESSRQGASYTLELAYLGPKESAITGSGGDGFSTLQQIDSQKFPTLASIRSRVIYPCRHIDQAGLYQAFLISSGDSLHPVAVSNPVEVVWSSAYSLSIGGDVRAILPCVGQFIVQYSKPSCAGNDDKIQLYSVRSRRVVDVEPSDMVYVTERRVGTPSTVSFACRHFWPNVTAHCFKYLSTAINGAVHNQKVLCLPTAIYPDADNISHSDPGWSSWSSWSDCVAPSSECDATGGRQSRHRTCDNPPPVNEYAPYCIGLSIEWADCTATSSCRHSDGRVRMTPPMTYLAKPGCECGCTLTEASGHVVASPLHIRDTCGSPERLEWLIAAPSGHVIRLRVVNGPTGGDAGLRSRWSVTVRDGNTSISDLLLSIPGSSEIAAGGTRGSDGSATSKSNMLRVEYRRDVSTSGGRNSSDSFVAVYETLADDGSLHDGVSDDVSRIPFSQTPSFLVVVIVCPLVVVLLGAAAAFLHLRLVGRRRMLLEKLDQSTPAHEALLPTAGTGPSESGNDAAGPSGMSGQHGTRRSNRHHHHHRTSATVGTDDKSSTDGNSDAGFVKDGLTRDKRASGRSSNGPSPVESRRPAGGQGHHGAKGLAPVAAGDDFDDDDDIEDERKTRRRRTKQRNSSDSETTVDTAEKIRMERYDRRGRSGRKVGSEDDEEETTCMLEKRPPVEGASLTRDHVEITDEGSGGIGDIGRRVKRNPVDAAMTTARYIPPTKSTVAAVRDLRRPDLDGARLSRIPLLEDGARTDMLHGSDELSPLTGSRPLFGDEDEDDEGRPGSPALSDAVVPDGEEVELEYDDYVPELPGSYFTMDPHAYTLTWSKQAAPWDLTGTGSQTAADSDDLQPSVDGGGRSASGQYYY